MACLIWMLVRIIPKPSRAQYPCMKVAAPMASGFLVYVAGLAATIFSFRKARHFFRKSNYILASVLILSGAAIGLFTILHTDTESYAFSVSGDSLFVPTDPPNSPMGTGKGIFPGRVVWMWDSTATTWDGRTGYWWDDNVTHQEIVDSMLSKSLRALTGKSSDAEAWDALFRYFNEKHGKGSVRYQAGEKIAIKINLNLIGGLGNPGNASFPSPQAVLALLRQLVNKAGVQAADITFYDTNRYVPDAICTKCKNEFPGVHFMGWSQINGREKYVRDTTRIHWSENLTMEINGGHTAYLPTVVTQAAYLINLANFKAHRYVGVTFCTKNHFGTISCDGNDGLPYQNAPHAAGLHCYVAVHDITIPGSAEWSFTGRPMGTYNALVDLMGHKDLGGKTLLFMIDALYGMQSEQDAVLLNSKWLSAPFNNHWTSSLLLSQDNLAIESVGLDFFRSEQSVNPNIVYVYGAVDNYLHEAALADNPPSGTFYHPNGDSVRLQSLGVHEHWNNPTDKQYSRNLQTGNGIELIKLQSPVTSVPELRMPSEFVLLPNYPNPFNPSTTISFITPRTSNLELVVYDLPGRVVRTLVSGVMEAGRHTVVWDGKDNRGVSVGSGSYFYQLRAGSSFVETRRMILAR